MAVRWRRTYSKPPLFWFVSVCSYDVGTGVVVAGARVRFAPTSCRVRESGSSGNRTSVRLVDEDPLKSVSYRDPGRTHAVRSAFERPVGVQCDEVGVDVGGRIVRAGPDWYVREPRSREHLKWTWWTSVLGVLGRGGRSSVAVWWRWIPGVRCVPVELGRLAISYGEATQNMAYPFTFHALPHRIERKPK